MGKRLAAHEAVMGEHESRIEQVESQLGDPGRHLTPEQAMSRLSDWHQDLTGSTLRF
jgi:hypothetical protein